MIAVCILLAVCLLAMTITAIAAVKDMASSHVEALRQAEARRLAEVAGARMEEALLAARESVDRIESLYKAERERADILEEEVHDGDVLLSTGGGVPSANTRVSRDRLLSGLKRYSNLAAGPDRARSASDPGPVTMPVAASARGVGDPPTRPGE